MLHFFVLRLNHIDTMWVDYLTRHVSPNPTFLSSDHGRNHAPPPWILSLVICNYYLNLCIKFCHFV
ncbi:rCG51700, partial [Rattus norvegicus]